VHELFAPRTVMHSARLVSFPVQLRAVSRGVALDVGMWLDSICGENHVGLRGVGTPTLRQATLAAASVKPSSHTVSQGAVPFGRTSSTPRFAIIASGRGLIAVIRYSHAVTKLAADDVPDGVGGSTGPGAVGAWGGGGSADTAWNSAVRRGSSKRSHAVREVVIANIGGR
jgi:hypothetical protein